jgi:hypothetical protein
MEKREREKRDRGRERERERERERWLEDKKSVFCLQGRNTNYIPAGILVIFHLQMCLPGRNTNYVPPGEKSGKSCKL